ncbi:MAG: hypothetical protein WCC99_19790 [Candidatus Sulfotelmatobacter sp.]
MTRHVKLVICLIVALRTGPAFSQVAATQANSDVLATAGAPAAFVYVSSSSSNNDYEINAYATASDGRLTPVPGSPFPGNVQYIAANKKYLFGTNGIDID